MNDVYELRRLEIAIVESDATIRSANRGWLRSTIAFSVAFLTTVIGLGLSSLGGIAAAFLSVGGGVAALVAAIVLSRALLHLRKVEQDHLALHTKMADLKTVLHVETERNTRFMEQGEFVAYVGDPRIHDATITQVQIDGSSASITLQSYEGDKLQVRFCGVESVKANRAQGMLLYSLSELTASGSMRCFVFTNSDDEDDAQLSIWAEDFDTVEMSKE